MAIYVLNALLNIKQWQFMYWIHCLTVKQWQSMYWIHCLTVKQWQYALNTLLNIKHNNKCIEYTV